MQYDLAEFALKMVAPNNKLIYDDKGIPSVMVYVPKFKMSDVIDGAGDSTHPAFIVNGKEVPGIWISKYQNIVNNGRAYSLPGQDPTVNITWDTARGYCESKGKGWHMMTKAEWPQLCSGAKRTVSSHTATIIMAKTAEKHYSRQFRRHTEAEQTQEKFIMF